jgi:hypothetical protein
VRRFGITLEKLTSGTELVRYCWTVAEFSVETEEQLGEGFDEQPYMDPVAAYQAAEQWIHRCFVEASLLESMPTELSAAEPEP